MALKDQTFIDKYLEKLILGGAAVIALILLWMYVFSSPYDVDISGQVYTPETVMEHVERERQMTAAAVDSSEAPEELRSLVVPDYTRNFEMRYRRPILPGTSTYPIPLEQWGVDPRVIKTGVVERPIVVPDRPAPRVVAARAGFGVLGDVPAEIDALAGIKQAPRDFRYVTVAAEYPLGQWERSLKVGPDIQRIPEHWWARMMGLAHVTLERQTLDPRTGEWSEAELIAPLPADFPSL